MTAFSAAAVPCAAILVTGATGFLGGAVAAELLTRGASAELLVLVRAPDSRSGLQKLRDSVRGVSAANRRKRHRAADGSDAR